MSLILGFGVVVLALGMTRGENTLLRYYELLKSQAILESVNAELERENTHLADEIDKIKKSSAYARRVLKEKYHVTEDGERIYFYGE